ncbi:MAG: hypothetical protein ACP5NE_00455 [Candidatus Micrarchaeia archaeon]
MYKDVDKGEPETVNRERQKTNADREGGKLLRKDGNTQIQETLGLTKEDSEVVYKYIANSNEEKFYKLLFFMKDFGVKESASLIRQARDEDGLLNPEALTLLFLEALQRYGEGYTSDSATLTSLQTFSRKGLKGTRIVNNYRDFEKKFLEQNVKEMLAKGNLDKGLIQKLKDKLDNISGMLMEGAIPEFYKIKKGRESALDYFG